jgi:hypothetical protein
MDDDPRECFSIAIRFSYARDEAQYGRNLGIGGYQFARNYSRATRLASK